MRGRGWGRERCKEDTEGEKRWRGGGRDNGRTGDTESLQLSLWHFSHWMIVEWVSGPPNRTPGG